MHEACFSQDRVLVARIHAVAAAYTFLCKDMIGHELFTHPGPASLLSDVILKITLIEFRRLSAPISILWIGFGAAPGSNMPVPLFFPTP